MLFMKLDKLDVFLATFAVAVNTGARVLTAYIIIYFGGVELNPFSRGLKNNVIGAVLSIGIALLLFLIIDPYRKVALSTYAGLLLADFAHDLCVATGLGAYLTFAVSVATAVIPLLVVTLYLLYKNDPRKEELKKRRNWKMFNL